VSGWVVDTDTAGPIAEAVINIHRNPRVAARAAARGPLFVRERFGMTRMIAETLQAYGVSAPCDADALTSGPTVDKELSAIQAGA
jgi:hypothetical protein